MLGSGKKGNTQGKMKSTMTKFSHEKLKGGSVNDSPTRSKVGSNGSVSGGRKKT